MPNKKEELKKFERMLAKSEAKTLSKESLKRPLTPSEIKRFKKSLKKSF